MRKKLPKILVTGGAGFIGSAFIRLLVGDRSRQSYNKVIKRDLSPIVIDNLTYAGDMSRLKEAAGKFKFYKTDICNKAKIERIFKQEKPDAVIHFAAESHVDRSIKDTTPFLNTNVNGTKVLLDVSRKYNVKKFIHISTDEVYGDIKKGAFRENSPLNPSSPYSASKAAADLLIKSYIRTFNFPAIIVRPCNNYGPWQYPEKLIPLAILKVLRSEKIPVYAKGKNVREWLYVEDCARGILKILEKGRVGEVYNIGSDQEKQNIEVVKAILKTLSVDKRGFEFVKDRPGHDIRYKLDYRKLTRETGWKPEVNLEEGLKRTVHWCLNHKDWLLGKWKNIASLYKKR